MKTFNQFIVEGRDAPVYHGTSFESFQSMCADDRIQPSSADYPTDNPNFNKTGVRKNVLWGISTTRNYRFAVQFIDQKRDTPIIIQLDQTKLAQKYKFIPYNWDFMSPNANGKTALARHTAKIKSDTNIEWSHSKYNDEDVPSHGVTSEFEEMLVVPVSGIQLSKYVTKIIVPQQLIRPEKVSELVDDIKNSIPEKFHHLISVK